MRKVLIIIVILAIAWAIPGVRGRIGVALLPLSERLGPVGDYISTPARRFSAKNDQTNIARIITTDFEEGRPVPDARTFQAWLKRRAPQMDASDPWGNAYWLVRARGTLTIGSNGVDGRRDTDDDVTHAIPF
jgi:hypothetical protein